MLRAHRQAWSWQDEYYGLTMDDIRRLERETQKALQEKMANAEDGVDGETAKGSPKVDIKMDNSTTTLTGESIS